MSRSLVLPAATASLGLVLGLLGPTRLGAANEADSLERTIDLIASPQARPSQQSNNALMAQAYIADGQQRVAAGDLRGALASFGVASTLDPKLVTAWWARARIRQELGQIDGAIGDLDQVVALQPKAFVAYFTRGRLKWLNNDPTGTVADMTAALALDSGYPGAYFIRGQARARLGEFATAIADYDRALALGAVEAEEIRALRLKAQSALSGKSSPDSAPAPQNAKQQP